MSAWVSSPSWLPLSLLQISPPSTPQPTYYRLPISKLDSCTYPPTIWLRTPVPTSSSLCQQSRTSTFGPPPAAPWAFLSPTQGTCSSVTLSFPLPSCSLSTGSSQAMKIIIKPAYERKQKPSLNLLSLLTNQLQYSLQSKFLASFSITVLTSHYSTTGDCSSHLQCFLQSGVTL